MSDLISRADAIEAVKKRLYETAMNNMEHGDIYTDIAENRIGIWLSALPSADAVEYESTVTLNIPISISAEAVQGWIPCSERLPSESGDYLCTIPLDEVDTYTEVLTFHKGNFYEVDDEWGTIYYDDVIAWMPLPTPYKGGDTE